MQNTTPSKIYLKLTELARKGDDVIESPILINSDFIALVAVSTLERSGPILIGQAPPEKVTLVVLHNGKQVNVKESLDEIEKVLIPPAPAVE